MITIQTAEYIISSAKLSQCPAPDIPEYGFIGRSNVGKSSLINMLTGQSKLARTSGQPGKTQTINHYLVNKQWYIADLPGYGYAKVSKTMRRDWKRLIDSYVKGRKNLISLFVLIDCRHKLLDPDREFMEMLGINGIPFIRLFTKADKTKPSELKRTINAHDTKMLETWESAPGHIVTSAWSGEGREKILEYVEETISFFEKP